MRRPSRLIGSRRRVDARVEVDPTRDMEEFGAAVFLVPGMPAEVLTVTPEHAMIDCLIEPFRDARRGSFREV